MANMSYCRFRNTNDDLADCTTALERVVFDGEEISRDEWYYAKVMKKWCERFIEVFEDCEEEEINIFK